LLEDVKKHLFAKGDKFRELPVSHISIGERASDENSFLGPDRQLRSRKDFATSALQKLAKDTLLDIFSLVTVCEAAKVHSHSRKNNSGLLVQEGGCNRGISSRRDWDGVAGLPK